jgi:hypothetical protein
LTKGRMRAISCQLGRGGQLGTRGRSDWRVVFMKR